MRIVKKEHHQVTSIFTYDIPEEDIVTTFDSVERFNEIVSHMNEGDWADPPVGEPPTDEEYDLFLEFLEDYNYDRYDDWWTDRKGGYDVTFELNNDDTEEGEDYDSDEETLH